MISIGRLKNYVNREFESKPENMTAVYLVLFLLCLTVIGYFGLYRGIRNYNEKRVLYAQVINLNRRMLEKITKINSLERYISGDVSLSSLDLAIPQDSQQATFLEQLTEVSSANGFILRDVYYTVSEENELELSAKFEGPLSQLELLLSGITNMDRLTRVKAISLLQYFDDAYLIDFTINTFYVPKDFVNAGGSQL